MQLSVVILNYNVRYYLQLCLLSVQRAVKNLEAEIIVVDNASPDESLAMLNAYFPDVKVIANDQNLGFARANNIGVAAASGAYVCILNPDTVVPENCFEQLLNCAKHIENLGALGVQLLDGTGCFLPESKRNVPVPRVALAKLMQQSKLYYANHVDKDTEGPVEVLVGAFMLLKREVYLTLGGFDEDYFMYGEDIDLSYRLLQAGYTNYYCGTLQALHFKGESTMRDKVYARRFYDAMGIFYEKHFSTTAVEKKMVNLTLIAAKNLKTLRYKKLSKQDQLQQPVVIFSKDPVFLEKLKQKVEVPISLCDHLPPKLPQLKNKMLILDAGSLSFLEIITCMKSCNTAKSSFRIRPPGCNFILGSDSSTRQGKVICVED